MRRKRWTIEGDFDWTIEGDFDWTIQDHSEGHMIEGAFRIVQNPWNQRYHLGIRVTSLPTEMKE
jgi:hypothetical protein